MRISEVPAQSIIIEELLRKYLPRVPQFALQSNKVELRHDLDLGKLKTSIDGSLEKYGTHHWQTSEGPNLRYYGFSLNYNPDHQDALDPNASSLGTPKNRRDQFYWATFDNHRNLKNSYYDTYAFRKRTPAASQGYLSEILDTCKRSIIRSRMMILDGSQFTDQLISAYLAAPIGDAVYGWHKDEQVYANLRINIPVTGDENFVFEMAGESPYVLEKGFAYSWDTNIPHRVYCRKQTTMKRYNLIVGISPWFDYDEQTDGWYPNEYCGKKSPFDMLTEGLIFPWLKK